MKKYVVIVAGGKGLRMGTDVPKQFLPVAGMPILMRTIRKFHDYDPQMGIVVVLPAHQIPYWNELCAQYQFDVPYQLALGGETRFHSVKNGLAYVAYASDVCVAVHDGVRPFVSESVIDAAFVEAQRSGAAVPVVPVVDSIREVSADGSKVAFLSQLDNGETGIFTVSSVGGEPKKVPTDYDIPFMENIGMGSERTMLLDWN